MLSRLMVVVIVSASAVNAYSTYAAHPSNVDVGHVIGSEHGHHEHVWPVAQSHQVDPELCLSHGSCQEEAGKAITHVHVNCCAPMALTPNEIELVILATSLGTRFRAGSQFSASHLSYPLLRPPRALV